MIKLAHDFCNTEHLIPLPGCYLTEAEKQLDGWRDARNSAKQFQQGKRTEP
jgi:hypothetical protein